MLLAPGSKLGHYEILSRLGKGGMGEVFRARDTALGRDVAIKVLPESLAMSQEALARFQVEARALAALSHPNIVGIYDLGSEDGSSYVVMELLEGETIREKLKEGVALPQRKAVEYTKEIARGLAAAHAKGIVHRDLKPENVFVTNDERVKILDFGLAKRTEKTPEIDDGETIAPGQAPAPDPTEPGTVMGTVGYMAPEQVRGLAVDHRADIFALGVILYELLTGKRAFKKTTSSDTMVAILRDEPPELSGTTSAISPALTRILRHCLEKNPEARSQSAHDVAFQLDAMGSLSTSAGVASAEPAAAAPRAPRRLVPVVPVAIAVLAVGAFALWRRMPSTPARAGAKRLAVLPFENLGSAEDDYFADGITDEVRGKLMNVPGLGVIARTSSASYKKTTKKPREIGAELGVDYLLTGTVRFAKSDSGARRVQVSPELVVAGTEESRWRQPFDATLIDVFQVQGEIATKVAQALDVALSEGSKKQIEKKPTENLAAYEEYLKGDEASQAISLTDPPSLRRAIDRYEKAVALDAGFVEAWTRLSVATSVLYFYTAPTPEMASRAREAAEKALALAPDRPEGHWALGEYYRNVTKEQDRALPEAERARTLAPRSPEYLTSLGLVEQALGRFEKAYDHLEEARRLDPRSLYTLRWLGYVALDLRRTADARRVFDAGVAIAPTNQTLFTGRIEPFLQEGDLAGARAVLASAPKEIDRAALTADIAQYDDLVWVLDGELRDLLLRLTPAAFDGDRVSWAIAIAQAHAFSHEDAKLKQYAELARVAGMEQVTAIAGDAQRQSLVALALAYLGRKDEAIREAKKAVALLPISRDARLGPYIQHQLVRVYIVTGEDEKAMDALEVLMKVPYKVTAGWLRIDPNFDRLRGNPRFVKLSAK
jgi:TolB-like protein/Flp pilus assembly protein TadD